MFSALAGFLEPGETIEDAVIREVKEEVGLDVSKVTYKFTQPWPFPYQLMIACFCEVESETTKLDEDEIHTIAERWLKKSFTFETVEQKLDEMSFDEKVDYVAKKSINY